MMASATRYFTNSAALLLATLLVMGALTARAADGGVIWIDGHQASADTILIESTPEISPAMLGSRLLSKGLLLQSVSLTDGTRADLQSTKPLNANMSHVVASVPATMTVKEAIEAAGQTPGVKSAWPNHILHLSFTPNDPGYETYQDNFRQVYSEEVWEFARGYGATVAVIDTGYRGEGLSDAIDELVSPYDFWGKDGDVTDYMGHGTHVAHTIAEATDNANGVAGLAWRAQIMPLKIFPDDEGGAREDDLLDAISYAVENGAHIINMSLGGSGYNKITENRLQDAFDAGVLPVCASGNDGESVVDYPGGYDACIAVGSVNLHPKGQAATLSDFSNYGQALDLVAPGAEIIQESWWEGSPAYIKAWGTSSAAPHVSAVAALMVGKAGEADPEEIRDILYSTAQDWGDEGWDRKFGHGEIHARDAVFAYAGDANDPPIVSLEVASQIGVPVGQVQLYGHNSVDPDGDIVTYLWDLGDGSYSSEISPLVKYGDGGNYTVSLTVTDNKGATDTAETEVHITDPGGQEFPFPCGFVGDQAGGLLGILLLMTLPFIVRKIYLHAVR